MKFQVNKNQAWLLFGAIMSFSFLSPKWNIGVFAWIAPALLLMLIKDVRRWQAFLLTMVVLFISGMIANYKVIPFPFVFLIPLSIQLAVLGSIPYIFSKLVTPRDAGWYSTLIFPTIAVVYEFLSSFGGGGTWGSVANTQINNIAFVQLASVTGIWGVSFLIYWFAALATWMIEQRFDWKIIRTPATVFSTIMIAVLAYGTIRINPFFEKNDTTVRVAGITALNIEPLLSIYEDAFGKKLDVDPATLTQTSPELAELNKALAVFIEDPLHKKFNRSHEKLEAFQDSLFAQAARESLAGAKIISFSEALMFTVKPKENELIDKGKSFAKAHQVRLLLTLGSFIPGKVEFGKKYIENKAIMINEQGEIENIFFKNKPVPIVEGSVPGDGEIPVIHTSHGNIATSICYDADFPTLMRKTSTQGADILLLPSGDWKEVSPFHADMARLRAIENGFSMLRPVSGATSIAVDYYGKVIASKEFYENGPRVLVAYLPVKAAFTLYSVAGDFFAWLCIGGALFFVLSVIYARYFGSRRNPIAA